MIVVTLTDCPAKLRGDISKWLFEIDTGVYVGNLGARVRDELWSRICENLKSGRAVMIYSASGEQQMEFKVHNASWEPVDFDGLKLMRRPSEKRRLSRADPSAKQEQCDAAVYQKLRRMQTSGAKRSSDNNYVVIDLETTGLSPGKDKIIELAAVRIRNGELTDEYSSLVKFEGDLPIEIVKITGITSDLLKEGRPLSGVLPEFLDFIGTDTVVGHNLSFDYAFIRAACGTLGVSPLTNRYTDTMALAKRKLKSAKSFQLKSLAESFSIDTSDSHRALPDCRIAYQLYEKLNEI